MIKKIEIEIIPFFIIQNRNEMHRNVQHLMITLKIIFTNSK